jgi:hypothetical protein
VSGEVGDTYSATASASRPRRADINIEVKTLAQAFSSCSHVLCRLFRPALTTNKILSIPGTSYASEINANTVRPSVLVVAVSVCVE